MACHSTKSLKVSVTPEMYARPMSLLSSFWSATTVLRRSTKPCVSYCSSRHMVSQACATHVSAVVLPCHSESRADMEEAMSQRHSFTTVSVSGAIGAREVCEAMSGLASYGEFQYEASMSSGKCSGFCMYYSVLGPKGASDKFEPHVPATAQYATRFLRQTWHTSGVRRHIFITGPSHQSQCQASKVPRQGKFRQREKDDFSSHRGALLHCLGLPT